MHAGVLLCPGGECGCEPQDLQSGLQSTHDATDGPGCRAAIPLKCRGPGKKSCWGEPVIPSPQTSEKEVRQATSPRPLPGPLLSEHCPSFMILQHNEDTKTPFILDTPSPWTLYSLLWTFYVLFLLNKNLSEA